MVVCSYLSHCFIVWITLLEIISCQDVIFGDPPGDQNGNDCRTEQGRPGRCIVINECPEIAKTFKTSPPVTCGFSGVLPIVCCPMKTEPVTEGPIGVRDISPPDIDFECGRSATKRVRLGTGSFPRFRRANRPFPADLPGILLNPTHITAVVGGIDAQRHAWPWMALLGAREGRSPDINWFCGGVLINNQWVLTAAHCLTLGSPNVVRLGEHNYRDDFDDADHQDFDILKTVIYPDYEFPKAYHDLALVQLSKKVNLQIYIAPVCLPWGDESQINIIGQQVKLTGWGDTQFAGNPSSILQEVDLTVFPNSRCEENYSTLRQFRRTWPQGMGPETVCVGDVNGGRDACQGDSGGPITYRASNRRYIVNGIVSTGYGCGNKDFPGIYANIQYPPHLSWIKNIAF